MKKKTSYSKEVPSPKKEGSSCLMNILAIIGGLVLLYWSMILIRILNEKSNSNKSGSAQ